MQAKVIPRMSSCSNCKTKQWTCLSCSKKVPVQNWSNALKTDVAVYCNCCDHQFVCKACYSIQSTKTETRFRYWAPKFGYNHAVKDLISGESSTTRLAAAMEIINNMQFDGPCAVFYDNTTDQVVVKNMRTGVKTCIPHK